jgi:phosphoenolpyruvate-protein kinase (PTS system EI component)
LEAELFEPEVAILNELAAVLDARIEAGLRAEEAVEEATSGAPTDLLVDVRARLLDGLAFDQRSVERLLDGQEGDRILVTESLTPSVVAALPARVVGILAAVSDEAALSRTGQTSHAAILARGRDIPLALAGLDYVRAVIDDALVVIDTTEATARIWTAPDAVLVEGARCRLREWAHGRAETEELVAAPLSHLGLEVHVNINSLRDYIPRSADGIGLVRTELLFSGRRVAPTVMEQVGDLLALVGRAKGAPVTVRLFDAGGDKPLPWLPTRDGSPDARGIRLLHSHPRVLGQQLEAIERAAQTGDVRALLPMVTCAEDVELVRERSHGRLPIGAMIETPQAVERADEIVAVSDFVSIGTNDLVATVTGKTRAESGLSVDPAVWDMIARVVASGHARGVKVTVCGEMAGDPHCARVLVGLGVDAISVATVRLGKVKLALRELSLDDCRQVARAAAARSTTS